jgi:hypothetical protein
MLVVFQEATKRVVHQAQAGIPHIPVDLGFARASILASLEAMPTIDLAKDNKERKSYSWDEGQVVLVIAGAGLGQTIYIGWTAAYVGALEHGHSQQAPSGFVRLAALEWQRIVSEVVAEAKARVG